MSRGSSPRRKFFSRRKIGHRAASRPLPRPAYNSLYLRDARHQRRHGGRPWCSHGDAEPIGQDISEGSNINRRKQGSERGSPAFRPNGHPLKYVTLVLTVASLAIKVLISRKPLIDSLDSSGLAGRRDDAETSVLHHQCRTGRGGQAMSRSR